MLGLLQGRRATHRIRDPLFIYGKPGDRGALGVKEGAWPKMIMFWNGLDLWGEVSLRKLKFHHMKFFLQSKTKSWGMKAYHSPQLVMRTVIVHLETVAPSAEERYGPDFKKMNKAAAIQWVVYHEAIVLRNFTLSLSFLITRCQCFKTTRLIWWWNSLLLLLVVNMQPLLQSKRAKSCPGAILLPSPTQTHPCNRDQAPYLVMIRLGLILEKWWNISCSVPCYWSKMTGRLRFTGWWRPEILSDLDFDNWWCRTRRPNSLRTRTLTIDTGFHYQGNTLHL